ncbi:MAG: rod-binding protein [Rhodobacteraceae bacterium]|nr:rod-binding protein [Paracoccaceae bacterium]
MLVPPPSPLPAPPAGPPEAAHTDTLHAAARELEAAFLSEMLTAAGLNRAPEGFGGGAGEDQFASFLTGIEARAMVKAGGIGLAEALFRALAGPADD